MKRRTHAHVRAFIFEFLQACSSSVSDGIKIARVVAASTYEDKRFGMSSRLALTN
jgi:hypothetical protein